MIGIYTFKSTITGQHYVGSSVNIKSRKETHIKDLTRKRHHSYKLQEHVNQYGLSDLEFIVLEQAKADDLEERERFYIDKLDSFYNGFNCTINTKRTVKEKHRKITKRLEKYSIEDEARLGVKYAKLEKEINEFIVILDNSDSLNKKIISSEYIGSSTSYFDCLCRTTKLLEMLIGYSKRKQHFPKKHKKFLIIDAKENNIETPCSRILQRLNNLKIAFQKKEPVRFINLSLSLDSCSSQPTE